MNPDVFPLNETRIFIDGIAGKIEVKTANTSQSGDGKITVVICHPHPLFGGTMDNKVVTTVFRTFRDMGARVIRFNYRGVGSSEGQYAAGIGETDDLISVCNWVKTISPHTALWLVGFSFGCYVVARAVNQVAAQQLITIAPAIEHFDFEVLDYPHCPWLVLQGETDEVVSPEIVYHWVKNHQNTQTQLKLITFPNTSHFFHGKLTDLKQSLENEFSTYFL